MKIETMKTTIKRAVDSGTRMFQLVKREWDKPYGEVIEGWDYESTHEVSSKIVYGSDEICSELFDLSIEGWDMLKVKAGKKILKIDLIPSTRTKNIRKVRQSGGGWIEFVRERDYDTNIDSELIECFSGVCDKENMDDSFWDYVISAQNGI